MGKIKLDLLSMITILLMCICSVLGILSLDFTNRFNFMNQYGDIVAIYGSGVYAGDTYFKAPLQIGTDFCILLFVVPLFIFSMVKKMKEDSYTNKVNLMSLYVVALYYSMSIAFGVKYNQLHLVYIMLFGCTLFGIGKIYREISLEKMEFPLTRGLKTFLVISGIVLCVAWLPDIIPTIINNEPLQLIGVYTTEITYVIDMGIIAPLCFICIVMLGKKDSLGVIILAAILKLYIVVGVMMIPQTICQYLAGIEFSIPALVTKSLTFMMMGGIAVFYERKLYAIN